ncbi:MAG: hypothetical protein ACK521_04830 [bacterium]|jgi:hypothetical protein
MKSFAETQKGKKVKKKDSMPDDNLATNDQEKESSSGLEKDELNQARDALKKRLSGSSSGKKQVESVQGVEETKNAGF